MCGISGFIGRSKEDWDREAVLKKMMDKIIHRGPDQEGMYVNDQVALGFRRLSIIDLDHGVIGKVIQVASFCLCFINNKLSRIADHKILLVDPK